jgi:hypothetical protein
LTGKYLAQLQRFSSYQLIYSILQTLKKIPQSLLTLLLLLLPGVFHAQMITGVWKGKINRQKAEIKIIQNGDSLTGSAYYFESANNYRRYSIKGYFDPNTNAAVWWDDQLVEEKNSRFSLASPGKIGLLSRADFNCPGGGKMMLDGKTAKEDEDEKFIGEVHLDKSTVPTFNDEWDFVIENYTVGANDPDLIDSITLLTSGPKINSEPVETIKEEKTSIPTVKQNPVIKIEEQKETPVLTRQEPLPAIQEKFNSRKNILVKEIPLSGDSIELRFYDNAQIDGDSISLFLNGKLVFEHIRLTGKAYTIKLSVAELKETNDLIMVAENLGSIPPNTSYMVAIVDNQRYDARLESTEGSSAMIRFVKKALSH